MDNTIKEKKYKKLYLLLLLFFNILVDSEGGESRGLNCRHRTLQKMSLPLGYYLKPC